MRRWDECHFILRHNWNSIAVTVQLSCEIVDDKLLIIYHGLRRSVIQINSYISECQYTGFPIAVL
jgi:hypothetical protein